MFKCDICKEQQGPGIEKNLVTTAIRTRTYRSGKETYAGYEIVKEVSACARCAGKDVEPEIVGHKEDEYVYTKERETRPERSDSRM